jgi:hypothetical protein
LRIATIKKWPTLVLACVLVAICSWLIWGLDRDFSEPFATFVATSGEVGDFRIGETKEAVLSRLAHRSFAVGPKPKECPINWIEVGSMSEVYRECLLRSDHWEEGSPSTSSLCPERSDVHTKLAFNGNKLVSVTTECWHPQ